MSTSTRSHNRYSLTLTTTLTDADTDTHQTLTHTHTHEHLEQGTFCRLHDIFTGWRWSVGCLQLQVSFQTRDSNYRALLWKWPVKIRHPVGLRHPVSLARYFNHLRDIFMHTHTQATTQMYRNRHTCLSIHVHTHTYIRRICMYVCTHTFTYGTKDSKNFDLRNFWKMESWLTSSFYYTIRT